MPGPDEQADPRDPDRLPDALTQRLSSMHDARLSVPPQIDQAVLSRAQERFADTPDTRALRWRRIAAPLAAAAAIALGVWIVWPSATPPTPSPPIVIAGDIDHNGSVDILDAFALARRLDAGQPVPANWDMTADGRVDRADVSAITTIAVSLSGGSNPGANPGTNPRAVVGRSSS
jgi:Dockerin type I domain